MQAGHGIRSVRVDRNDVGVLQAGEGLRFAGAGSRDLERDGTIGELAFLGAEDAGEGAAADFGDEVEAADGLAGVGEFRRRRGRAAGDVRVGGWARADDAVDIEDAAERFGAVGKSLVVLGGVGRAAFEFLAEAVFLVDQRDEGVAIEVGVAGPVGFDAGRLSRFVPEAELAAEQREQDAWSERRVFGEEIGGIGAGLPRRGLPGDLEPTGDVDGRRG